MDFERQFEGGRETRLEEKEGRVILWSLIMANNDSKRPSRPDQNKLPSDSRVNIKIRRKF